VLACADVVACALMGGGLRGPDNLSPLPLFNRRNAAKAAASLGVGDVPGPVSEFDTVLGLSRDVAEVEGTGWDVGVGVGDTEVGSLVPSMGSAGLTSCSVGHCCHTPPGPGNPGN